jgi:hypothetical protein
MTPAVPPQHRPLSIADKGVLIALALLLTAFGALVEMRGAFLKRRMTDAGVYFRAAWAVRSGDDLYTITDDNDWHYCYPPLPAILLAPLADAPAGEDRTAQLPYPVSLALWLLLNITCAAVAAHWLARAVEESSPDPLVRQTPPGCRAWWRRRVLPLLICLPPVAHTLMRGQVNLILLLLVAGLILAHVRGRTFQAGLWLAGAICLKIIPAFLLVFPLWRREGRLLKGCAAGLAVGLFLIPGVVMGPSRTVHCYQQLANAVLRPGLTHQGDETRAKELTNVTGTESQSFSAILHNTVYLDRTTRPDHTDATLKFMATAAGALVTLITLLAASRRLNAHGPHAGADLVLAWGVLLLPMLFLSPVSHLHYFCLCVPLVSAALALAPPRGWALAAWVPLVALFVTANVLPHVPDWWVLRDVGVAMYGGLLCWTAGVTLLLRRAEKPPLAVPVEVTRPLAA